MPKVFISYAHSDAAEAQSLVKALHEENVVGWLDSADIAAGEAVSSAVRDALKNSSIVIVLLSQRALHSQWVQFEIGAAEALDKRIIPVIVSGDVVDEEIPDILRNRRWIDGRDRPYEDVVRDVKRAVESVQE
jgi:hypothetical protein